MTIAESRGGGNQEGSQVTGSVEGNVSRLKALLGDYLVVIIILLSASAAFGFGMLAERANAPAGKDDGLWIESLPAAQLPAGAAAAAVMPQATTTAAGGGPSEPAVQAQPAPVVPAATGTYVASKTGKMFYLPTCSTAKRIKEENKVWFATKADAEKAGYAPAKNCKGL